MSNRCSLETSAGHLQLRLQMTPGLQECQGLTLPWQRMNGLANVGRKNTTRDRLPVSRAGACLNINTDSARGVKGNQNKITGVADVEFRTAWA
jgi:hypothetical protein